VHRREKEFSPLIQNGNQGFKQEQHQTELKSEITTTKEDLRKEFCTFKKSGQKLDKEKSGIVPTVLPRKGRLKKKIAGRGEKVDGKWVAEGTREGGCGVGHWSRVKVQASPGN